MDEDVKPLLQHLLRKLLLLLVVFSSAAVVETEIFLVDRLISPLHQLKQKFCESLRRLSKYHHGFGYE